MSKQKDNLLTQIDVATKGQDGTITAMTTWVDADNRIKEGVKVLFKGDDREWSILKVYNTELRHSIDNRGWDNNNYDKHDGTSMRDRLGE